MIKVGDNYASVIVDNKDVNKITVGENIVISNIKTNYKVETNASDIENEFTYSSGTSHGIRTQSGTPIGVYVSGVGINATSQDRIYSIITKANVPVSGHVFNYIVTCRNDVVFKFVVGTNSNLYAKIDVYKNNQFIETINTDIQRMSSSSEIYIELEVATNVLTHKNMIKIWYSKQRLSGWNSKTYQENLTNLDYPIININTPADYTSVLDILSITKVS